MDREELEAALAVLLDQMEGDQGDSHEVYLRLRQILDGMRAMGMPLPDDLVNMERELAADFEDDANGAKAP
jgi:hypothetical protein